MYVKLFTCYFSVLFKLSMCIVTAIHFVMQDLVKSATTENCTLIDCVYVKDIELNEVKIDFMPTLFTLFMTALY